MACEFVWSSEVTFLVMFPQGVNGLKGDKGDAGLSGPQGPSVSTANNCAKV